ncbi:MAG TPA: MFS transporter [bacterium]|nr:MFS transporter [bacterium]
MAKPSSTTSPGSTLRNSLPLAVVVLGVVSLLTDLSSEMIYPLLPLYLSTVLGAGAVSLGVIEGVAESTAALLKVVSGVRSDITRRRKPLVAVGYTLSNLVRPLIGLATVWPMVLVLRFADRVGKGLRTSPRDALIADVTDESIRGRAYGLHRSMDHAGAVLGPLAAMALLSLESATLQHVFLASAIPGALVIVTVLLAVREPPQVGGAAPGAEPSRSAHDPTATSRWAELGPGYRRFLLALVVFTLGNSSDAFLLLQLSREGFSAVWITGLWSAFHVVKMVSAYGAGRLSDRVGRRGLMLTGWAIYAAVYAGFAVGTGRETLIVLFLVYGLYYGCTEPVERAWVSSLAPGDVRGTAFGAYHGAIGIAALPASVLFGMVLDRFGAAPAFFTGAGLALVAALILLRVPEAGATPAT